MNLAMEGLGGGGKITPRKFQAISSTFNPRKSQISSLFNLSRWPPFDHALGSLDIEPVYSRWCPSITATCSISNPSRRCSSAASDVVSCAWKIFTGMTEQFAEVCKVPQIWA